MRSVSLAGTSAMAALKHALRVAAGRRARRHGAQAVAAFVFMGIAAPAAAEPPPAYNQVELQAEAQRELPNDTMNASLYLELSDANPAVLAAALNTRVNEALHTAREFAGVQVRSGSNQTYPVYSKGNVLQAWRARAEVRLESKDFEALSRLIGKLQGALQLGSTAFSVSAEARRAAEDELIAAAIAAFKRRAEIARVALGGRSYKIRRINVHAGVGVPPPRMALARAMAAEAPPPMFEGGTSALTVTASGAIEVFD